jgi:hypothetical protein
MNTKLKSGLYIGGAVLAAIIIYQYVGPSGAANSSASGGIPITTSVQMGAAVGTAALTAALIVFLLPVGL